MNYLKRCTGRNIISSTLMCCVCLRKTFASQLDAEVLGIKLKYSTSSTTTWGLGKQWWSLMCYSWINDHSIFSIFFFFFKVKTAEVTWQMVDSSGLVYNLTQMPILSQTFGFHSWLVVQVQIYITKNKACDRKAGILLETDTSEYLVKDIMAEWVFQQWNSYKYRLQYKIFRC